ncbi:MAG TPA: hypothetical protein VM802_16720 [Chitinophaga sp.]|uniref:hypothetical protein n=1 Tax=Chitinophaga sp. TaxID=1869181 RepID=UPI002D093620|nr:hypothetical protein [Chitinophaga sp.]HVI46522.1 hypothetical protein [Chitinophaga sp.]
MKKIELITNVYPNWKPSDIAFIKTVEWSTSNIMMIVYCQLRGDGGGWPDMSNDFFEVILMFSNVSHFRLDFTAKGVQQISGCDILDVSGNGLENINYQIEDYENDIINFSCEEIEVIEVSTPFKIGI